MPATSRFDLSGKVALVTGASVLTQNPMHRIGLPEGVASGVLFLTSDAASYVNGEVLVIDGGGGEV